MALALVGGLLFAAMTVALQERRVGMRLSAQSAAAAAIEATIESLRVGALPLESALVAAPWPPPAESGISPIVLFVDVEPQALPNLYRLSVEARYLQFAAIESQRIETLHWRSR